eukprot:g71254.t1
MSHRSQPLSLSKVKRQRAFAQQDERTEKKRKKEAKLRIGVGSTSAIKVGAVQDAWPEAEVVGIAGVASGVPDQPVGARQTRMGAINRLFNARAKAEHPDGCGPCDLYVGIENGMVRDAACSMGEALLDCELHNTEVHNPDDWYDVGWIALQRNAVGHSALHLLQTAAVKIPKAQAQAALKPADPQGGEGASHGEPAAHANWSNSKDPHQELLGPTCARRVLLAAALKRFLKEMAKDWPPRAEQATDS